jgi:hypothetical protein
MRFAPMPEDLSRAELTTAVDFSLYGLEDGTDACYVSQSEQHVVKGGRVYIVDGDADEVTLAAVPIMPASDGPPAVAPGQDETRSIFAVETVGGVAYWIYTDEFDGTNVYSYEAGKTQLRFSIDDEATLTFARGNLLLVACGNTLYRWDGSSLISYAPHSRAITGAQILDNVLTTVFEDGIGGLWTPGAIGPDGDLPFAGLSRARFNGAAGTIRGAASGSGETIYLQDGTGAYVPVAADPIIFPDGSVVPALERHGITILPGSGDPLNGGTEPVVEESLLGIVNKPSGAWLFRYQATRPGAYAYRTGRVEAVVFEEK